MLLLLLCCLASVNAPGSTGPLLMREGERERSWTRRPVWWWWWWCRRRRWCMWEQEERLCSVLAAALVHLPPSAMPPRPMPASSASTWQRTPTWTRRETEPDVHTSPLYAPRRESGALHSRTETPRRELLMENGDRQKVLQHRLLGIYPDHLDFQRIVAWSGGSHVPPAIHVSDGQPDWKHSGAPMGGNFGLVRSALVSRDTSVIPIYLLLLHNLCWWLHQCKGWVFTAQCCGRCSPQYDWAYMGKLFRDHLFMCVSNHISQDLIHVSFFSSFISDDPLFLMMWTLSAVDVLHQIRCLCLFNMKYINT